MHESTVSRTVPRLETLLTSSRRFTLPGKKQLTQPDYEVEVIVIDVSETPIERPKKNKNATESAAKAGRIILPAYCLGKKKRHTLKAQVVVERGSLKIICTAHGVGREHE